MLKITKETINGRLCTVISYEDNARREWRKVTHGYVAHNPFNPNHLTAQALLPLPRHPTEKDAPLLYRYASETNCTLISYS